MNIINTISTLAMPTIILIIVMYSFLEKNKVYEDFLEGAKEGGKIVIEIFPTLIGLFFSVSIMRNSGILDLIIKIISPFINVIKIPKEIMPLALLRPISGSASMAVAIDIIKTYGVDSKIGKICSIIMGSTETSLYIIALYTSCIKVKNTRFIIISALIGDVVGIIMSVIICNFL